MKKLFKKCASGGSVLIVSLFLVNIINFIFNAYLGRVLSFEAFGLIALLNTMWSVIFIFLTALYVTVNHRSAFIIGQKGTGAGAQFLKATNKKILLVTLLISVIWVAMIPITDSFFQIRDFLVTLLFTPMITLGALVAANKGFLQGNFNFRSVAVIIVLEALSKLLLAVLFISSNLSYWVYTSIPLSVLLSYILAYYFTAERTKETTEKAQSFPKRFFIAALISGFSSMAFLTFDVLLAKHYLVPQIAGQYALLSLIGKMVYFFGALPSALIITYVSNDRGKNVDPKKIYYKIFSATVLLSVGGFLGLGLLGNYIVPFLLGQKTVVILPYLLRYSGAITLLAITSSLTSYHLAKQQYLFPYLSISMAVLMCLGIIIYHADISQITTVIFAVSIISFISVVTLHLLETIKVPFAMKYMKTL